jgi:hypothetical protein
VVGDLLGDELETVDGREAVTVLGRQGGECVGRAHDALVVAHERGYRLVVIECLETLAALTGDRPTDIDLASFDTGRALELDAAVELVRRMRGGRDRPTHGWASLTPTERAVVDRVAVGCTNAQIAEEPDRVHRLRVLRAARERPRVGHARPLSLVSAPT